MIRLLIHSVRLLKEERLKGLLKDIVQNADQKLILFIDEVVFWFPFHSYTHTFFYLILSVLLLKLHTLVGAGAAEGGMDASNMLKVMKRHDGFLLSFMLS